jgi:hypothetical protein
MAGFAGVKPQPNSSFKKLGSIASYIKKIKLTSQ